MKKKDIPYFPLSFCEIIYLKKTYIFIPNIDYLYCYHFSLEDRKMAFKEKVHFPNVEILFLLKEKNNNIFICCKDQIIYKQNVFIKITKKEYKNFPIKNVKSGIKINNNFIAFKSCNIKNSFIKFYNCNSQKIINKDLKGYSFIYSTNGLAIMPREETNSNNKILLCACKKYLKNQKNGILLVNLIYSMNILNKSEKFYCTGNFEVYCFCPILIKDKNEVLKNKWIMKDSEFFLVGGFSLNKNQGLIKLYKIVYRKDHHNTKIEYIEDIILENNLKNFHFFKGPISSMIQSSIDGSILITCWDSNVYLFSYPNIESFLKYNEKVQNNLLFEDCLIKNNQ